MNNIPKKYHPAVRKLIKKARAEERAEVIDITKKLKKEKHDDIYESDGVELVITDCSYTEAFCYNQALNDVLEELK